MTSKRWRGILTAVLAVAACAGDADNSGAGTKGSAADGASGGTASDLGRRCLGDAGFEKCSAGLECREEDWIGVFVCTKDGKPWVVYDLSRRVSRCIRSLGIEGTLHSLRHTYVTALVFDPLNDPKTVQRLARHRDIGTTFNFYAHAQAPRLRQAVGRLSLSGRICVADLCQKTSRMVGSSGPQ